MRWQAGHVRRQLHGLPQWAALAAASGRLQAIVPQITNTRGHAWVYPDAAFALDARLRWITLIERGELGRREWAIGREQPLTVAFQHLPLLEAGTLAVSHEVPFYRDWLHHAPDDPTWQAYDLSAALAFASPAHLIGGWYDYMLRGQLQDYAALRAAGQTPYLTIGSWTHGNGRGRFTALPETQIWLDAQLKHDRRRLRRSPVRIFVMGADEWREFESSPSAARATRLYLRSAGALG